MNPDNILFTREEYTSSIRRVIYGACIACLGVMVGLALGMMVR